MIWRANWKDSGSIKMRIACTLRSAATRHQKPREKPLVAVLTSTNSNGNRIAAGRTSYPKLPEYHFAMHRRGFDLGIRPDSRCAGCPIGEKHAKIHG